MSLWSLPRSLRSWQFDDRCDFNASLTAIGHRGHRADPHGPYAPYALLVRTSK
jgi:hypothetical protein